MAYREKGDKKKERRDKEEQRKSALARYPEAEPFDQVQYLEGKLILQPDHFTSVETFRDFGGLVQRTARALGVGFLNDPNTQKRPAMREILFFDTPDIRLYKNCFILRRRTSYVDGFPVGDPEIVFKFRHPDEQKAAAVDVRPLIAGKYRIKFKAEALPVKNQVGGYRILYSHNCQFGLSQVHEADRMAMSTLVRVLPALSAIKKSAQERVSLVNKAIVEEVLLPLGKLDFGRGTVAKCDVALWRTRGEHKPLVGEFAFQVKFNQKEDFHKKARRLCEQFFITLQYDVKDWLSLDTTKTGVVYSMQYGNDLQSYE